MNELTFFILVLYFLPALKAFIKGKRDAWAIFALNLLLGWTFIGWVVALVWALTEDNPLFERKDTWLSRLSSKI